MRHAHEAGREQRNLFIVSLMGAVFVTMILAFALGAVLRRHEVANLESSAWLLVPADSGGILTSLLEGRCPVGDSGCGSWTLKPSLDFSRLRNARDVVYLVADVDFSKFPVKERIALHFDEAYGEISAWVSGKYIGTTSRSQRAWEKPLFFASAEALPIPDEIARSRGVQRIVVEVRTFRDFHQRVVWRLSTFGLVGMSGYLEMQFLLLVLTSGSILSLLVMSAYHFFVWLRRRDAVCLGFAIYALVVGAQNFFYYHTASYFGISQEIIYRLRFMTGYMQPVAYAVFCLFMKFPISFFFREMAFRFKRSRSQGQWQGFSLATKWACAVVEIWLLCVTPVLMLTNLVLPVEQSVWLLYRVGLPANLLLMVVLYFVMVRHFAREAMRTEMRYALPFALGLGVLNVTLIAGILTPLGVRAIPSVTLSLGCLGAALLFAVSIGNQYTMLLHRVEKLKSQLELVLSGTREVSQARSLIQAAGSIAGVITPELRKNASKEFQARFYYCDETSGRQKDAREGEKGFLVADFGTSAIPRQPTELQRQRLHEAPAFLSSLPEGGSSVVENDAVLVPVRHGAGGFGVLEFSPISPDRVSVDDLHFLDTLSLSLATSLENISYVQDRLAKIRIQAELEAAQAVQYALLPRQEPPRSVRLTTHFQAASQTGGDWYGYFHDSAAGTFDVFVGDVTGHGVPAALISGVGCGAIYAAIDLMRARKGHSLTMEERLIQIAEVTNRIILRTGNQQYYMTMAFVSVDLATGKFAFVNAAHCPPLALKVREAKVISNALPGSRLGHSQDPRFHAGTGSLEPGDGLFIYTDGLVENEGPGGDIFSDGMLRRLLLANLSRSPEEIGAAVLARGREIWRDATPKDDVSFVALKWMGPEAGKEAQEEQIQSARGGEI